MQGFFYGAEDEARTRDNQLGRLELYQLSYFRINNGANILNKFALMQVFFSKSLKLTSGTVFNKEDSNHKEFNMKILYLYSTKKTLLKNNEKHQKNYCFGDIPGTTSCSSG